MRSFFLLAIAAALLLVPLLAVGLYPARGMRLLGGRPRWLRWCAPAPLGLAYLLVCAARGGGTGSWRWAMFYLLLPVALAALLDLARRLDPEQKGTAIDFAVLLLLGLAVDLRWLERAWPAHLAVFGKMLLLDGGVYGFGLVRGLTGVGFDLRLRIADLQVGVREFGFYTPVALVLGLAMGFLHLHALWPSAGQVGGALLFTFLFVALPEELFFRGWMQNLLERRLGRVPALLVTAGLFGLSHFNKRTAGFNWQYVVLATLAGVFYGRAWRAGRRVAASALTHTLVDSVWSIWLR